VINTWTSLDGGVEWKVRLAAPTRFKVAAVYNTAAKNAHGAYNVTVADQKLSGHVTPTENVSGFRTDALGEIVLPAGEFTIAVHATDLGGENLMRLRQLELAPLN
jgi:hypothetical protein